MFRCQVTERLDKLINSTSQWLCVGDRGLGCQIKITSNIHSVLDKEGRGRAVVAQFKDIKVCGSVFISSHLSFMFPSCTSSARISSTATPLARRKFRQAWNRDMLRRLGHCGVLWVHANIVRIGDRDCVAPSLWQHKMASYIQLYNNSI